MKHTSIQIACEFEPLPSEEQINQWFATACLQSEASMIIRFVQSQESQQINLQYRQKDKPTNVLSFAFDCPEHIDPQEVDYLLGDLIICPEIVAQEAQNQGKSLMDHFAHMIIHGTLHLQGYDHIEQQQAQKMESLEIELLAKLQINDPYQLGPNNE